MCKDGPMPEGLIIKSFRSNSIQFKKNDKFSMRGLTLSKTIGRLY